jgi:hypothetical protein
MSRQIVGGLDSLISSEGRFDIWHSAIEWRSNQTSFGRSHEMQNVETIVAIGLGLIWVIDLMCHDFGVQEGGVECTLWRKGWSRARVNVNIGVGGTHTLLALIGFRDLES